MNPFSQHTCPVCGSSHWQVFFKMPEVPVFCNVLWPERQAALNCSKGNLELAFCFDCGFIGNVAFDPARLDYTQAYENALDFSPRFRQYAHTLATRLIERHNLHQKTVIEIGCGKGEFLLLLCELGNNRGIGFDPSYVPLEEHRHAKEKVTFIQDYYSQQYAEAKSDFICCRHTLEHIPQPHQLLTSLRQAIGDAKPGIFFEVPNALDTFCRRGVWDIIYEHCGYFSPVSLDQAFSFSGFKVQEVTEAFRGQFLCLEAIPAEESKTLTSEQSEKVKGLAYNIKQFTTEFKTIIETWTNKLSKLSNLGKRVVIWGAGSKGVTFLNFLKIQNSIEYVVDINPRKQGMYVAGTGQKIVPPDFLKSYQPDIVIVMNPIYEAEIQQMIEEMGIKNCILETGV